MGLNIFKKNAISVQELENRVSDLEDVLEKQEKRISYLENKLRGLGVGDIEIRSQEQKFKDWQSPRQ